MRWGRRLGRIATGRDAGMRERRSCTKATGRCCHGGRLPPAQVERLKQEIAKGVFHNAEQVRTWVRDALGVAYSL